MRKETGPRLPTEVIKNHRRFAITAGLGCAILVLLMLVVIPAAFLLPLQRKNASAKEKALPLGLGEFTPLHSEATSSVEQERTGESQALIPQQMVGVTTSTLVQLYRELTPGMVSVHSYGQKGASDSSTSSSGFIYSDTGYILTDFQRIKGAKILTVTFSTGEEVEAVLAGTDEVTGIAVLKVNSLPPGVHPLSQGDSDQVEVGEWILSIANPAGKESSMNTGIVSQITSFLTTGPAAVAIPKVIEVNAPAPPENSGGPLVNLKGEVIGILSTSDVLTPRGAELTRGFAIPMSFVQRIVPSIIDGGSYPWAWLGLEGRTVNLPIAKGNNLPAPRGAYIERIIPGGPADQAGLKGTSASKQVDGLQVHTGGDVIVQADGSPIDQWEDLLSLNSTKKPGDTIRLTFLRDGRIREVVVKLTQIPKQ